MTYKKNCVSCGAPIPIKRKHYNKYGSYCAKCTRVATKQSLLKGGELELKNIGSGKLPLTLFFD